jgi:hypothetical protein
MADLEKELLYRLLTNHFGQRGTEEQVYVGALPPEFPVPLPPGSRLLGATEQRSPPVFGNPLRFQTLDHTRVLLDSPLSVADFISQMRAGLPGDWEDFNWMPMIHSGFLPAEAQDALSLYNPALKKSLNVEALEVGGVTQVSLVLNSQSDETREHMRHHTGQNLQQVAVRVPAGATLQPGGGGGGGNTWHADAVIVCSQSASELLDHFGSQLQGKGWQPLTSGQTGNMQARCWSDPQGSLVFITLDTNENHVANMVTVKAQRTDEGGSVGMYTLRSDS